MKTPELIRDHSVTATSIYRFTLLLQLTQVDMTRNYADAAVWSAVEPNVAVISACLPMLQLVLKLVGGSLGSMSSLGKSHKHAAGTVGTADNENLQRPSFVSTTKDGRLFARLAEVSSSSDRREEWELWEG